jgi:microcystin-dependent protein
MKATQLICIAIFLLNAPFTFAQGTAFTYQGRLTDGSIPANGNYDFRFILNDAPSGGSGLATNQFLGVAVSNGLFTVALDFGEEVFNGSSRWLQIGTRPYGSANPYTILLPHQPISAAPYAIRSADSTPVGSVIAFMGTNAPAGWLLCDGAAVGRAFYAKLFAVIGSSNGSGDGSTTFNLPDLRGTFLRGLDGIAGVDPDKATRIAPKPGANTGNSLGSLQNDQFKSHNHANANFNRVMQISGGTATTATASDVTFNEPDIVNTAAMQNAGGNETRPRNIYVNYIIKF